MHYQRYRYQGRLDQVAPPPAHLVCAYCGKAFNAKARRWGAIYCSSRCNDMARYHRTRRPPMRAEACEHCGIALPANRRTNTRFCSIKCGQDWRNTQTAALTLAAKADRPSCRGCGSPVPAAKHGKAVYCSDECKIRSRRHEAYGLTKVELDTLLAQHEVCAICKTAEWGQKGPCVDHDHDSGRVRGVLCGNCNQGLGRFADDPKRLRAAAAYLRR